MAYHSEFCQPCGGCGWCRSNFHAKDEVKRLRRRLVAERKRHQRLVAALRAPGVGLSGDGQACRLAETLLKKA